MDAIPIDLASAEHPLVIVSAKAGPADTPLSLVVDTGAAASFDLFLSEAAARRLRLATGPAATPASNSAIGAAAISFRPADVPEFRLGPVRLPVAKAAVTDVADRLAKALGRPVDGIVGHQFLKARTVAIDYAAKTMAFDAPPGPAKAAIPFSLAPRRPVMLVPVKVNGKGPFTVELDTGTSGIILSPDAARRAGLKTLAANTVSGAGGDVTARAGLASVAFGPVRAKAAQVTVLDSLTSLSDTFGTRLDGIIGGRLFTNTRLTIDYPGQRLWVEIRPPASRRR